MPARSLPGLGLQAFFDLGEDGWNDEMDSNILVLSALVNRNVISRTTVLPMTPDLGSIYIVPVGESNENQIAIWDGPFGSEAFTYLVPNIGWNFYVEDEDINVQWNGTAWVEFAGAGGGSPSTPYDQRIGFSSTPTANQVLDTIILPREVTILGDMLGSVGTIGTNPTDIFVISVQDDGVEFGTVTIGTDGSFSFTTSGGLSHVLASGSIVTFVAPNPADSTAANAAITIAGNL